MTYYKLTFREKIRKFFGLDTRYYNDLGELHREDGPAVIWSNGDQIWWLNGELHREDGPTYISVRGTKEWWLHGERHRDDGPAIIYSDGDQEWWTNHADITDEVNLWFEDCNLNYDDMEFEDKMALKFYIRGLSND